ncbi:hypothetical protein GCM10007981_02550 [Thermocladium modestius]|uniref:Uncharacterized protein n=1 Tax=Thermocladium modestius TaxID=62609 RepID=A0A830GUB5_9CREN|nr:hypothetical protein [Thermocladium modestius]GGP19324.1 hypothetical protein GCM10007981_02550 [Thermocladium modestius]
MNAENDVFDELVRLLSANALPLALIVALGLIAGIFAQLFHVTQYVYAALPLMLIGLIIYVLLTPVLRIYVQEDLISCKHANTLLAAVVGLIEIIVAGAEFYESPYMMLSSLVIIAILILAIYRRAVVDVKCVSLPTVYITIIPPGGVASEKRIQVRSAVTIGGPGSTIVVPAPAGTWIRIAQRGGSLSIYCSGAKMESEGSLRDVSGEVEMGDAVTLWLGETKVIIRRQ